MNKPENNYPRKFSVILRLFASAYLLYLAFSLSGSIANYEGTQKLVFIAAVAIFAVVGLFMGIISLKAYLKKEYAEAFEEAEEDVTELTGSEETDEAQSDAGKDE